MIIIKVNQVPNSKEALKQKTERAWKIKQDRLYNQDELAVMYQGEILEVYRVLKYEKDKIESNRIAFELEEKTSHLKGKKVVYKTSNPCTIVDSQNLIFA